MTERVAPVDETTGAEAALDALSRKALAEARAANALLDAVYAAIPVGLAFFTPDLR